MDFTRQKTGAKYIFGGQRRDLLPALWGGGGGGAQFTVRLWLCSYHEHGDSR